MQSDIIIGMAGSGGDGIVSAGESLMTAAALEGYHAIMTKSFGSQIRGGESSCRLRISTEEVLNPHGTLDLAIALNWEDWLKFGGELPVGGRTVVIYDSKTGVAPDAIPLAGVKPAETMAVPIEEIAKKTAGTEKAKNTVVLGLLAGWFGIARKVIVSGMRKKWGKKSPEMVEANERAFAAGMAYAQEHPLRSMEPMMPPQNGKTHMVADGNDMCGAAAIFAGCEFFSGYPITPSTEIMQFLNREIWKYGGTVLQAEDEIAGVGAVVGASFAGKKAMTATSGPGMSLKSEILGLATIAELPLVCVNVQRGGPSTGIPTKSEQADLFQAIFSAHGDAPRPVLAPISVADVFPITVEAFNIAERYQVPVVVLSDQGIGHRTDAIRPFDLSAVRAVDRRLATAEELAQVDPHHGFKRYTLTPDGVSPLTVPGQARGNYLSSGLEHNELGAPVSGAAGHQQMSEKRFRKLASVPERYAHLLIVAAAHAGWIALAVAAAALVAYLIGIPTLRLRGDYLAIMTIGLSEIIRYVAVNEKWLTRGSQGIRNLPRPFSGHSNLVDSLFYFFLSI
jgi:2-oxoglutarate ferredoxin oxidoreductase subunit alpha